MPMIRHGRVVKRFGHVSLAAEGAGCKEEVDRGLRRKISDEKEGVILQA